MPATSNAIAAQASYGAQNFQICAQWRRRRLTHATVQIGGSVRGYQAIFVPLAALSSPGYSPVGGQPAVYAALEANCPLMPLTACAVIPGARRSDAGRPQ
jgi:hypothetical protein